MRRVCLPVVLGALHTFPTPPVHTHRSSPVHSFPEILLSLHPPVPSQPPGDPTKVSPVSDLRPLYPLHTRRRTRVHKRVHTLTPTHTRDRTSPDTNGEGRLVAIDGRGL